MGTDPLYLPAKFSDDTLKPSKVMDKKLQKCYAPRNNTGSPLVGNIFHMT
jgi:hypothetical protein